MWALIEWCEEGSPLDIIKENEILQETYVEGDKVDVKYMDESSPAVILKLDDSKDKVIRFMNKMERTKPKETAELPQKRTVKKRMAFSPPRSPDQPSPKKKKGQTIIPKNDAMLMKMIINNEDHKRAKLDDMHRKNEMAKLHSEINLLKIENTELRALNVQLQRELLNKLAQSQPLYQPSVEQCQPQSLNQLQPLSLTQPLFENPSQTISQPQPLNPQFAPNKLKTSAQNLGISMDTLLACGRGGKSWSAMIKDLAVAVFGRETLATHGLSGKSGNANKGSTAKPALDYNKVKIILDIVHGKFETVPLKVIRSSLREKMNDEHKLRLRHMNITENQ